MNSINRVAISEVLDILNNMSQQDVNKISIRFMEYLNNNASKSYVSKIDFSKPLTKNQLSNDTLCYLYLIYIKYWCDTSEKEPFIQKMNILREKQERENREKYNPDKVFHKVNTTKTREKKMAENQKALKEYKESFFMKFKKFIFKIFFHNK